MGQKKKLISDSIWSIAGLVFMNVVLQFGVYKFWDMMAVDANWSGNAQSMISLMNVFAISLGIAVNYARMRRSTDGDTKNAPYLGMLFGTTAVAFAAAIGITFLVKTPLFGEIALSVPEILLYGCLTVATMWRYYADVEYKLYLNYKCFFLYYAFIGIGYLIGILLFYFTGLWPLTLLVGELFGLLFVLIFGKIFRVDGNPYGEGTGELLKLVLVLFGSEFMSNLIFNADRIVLLPLFDGEAVFDYYLASLLGKTVALLTVPLSGVVIGYLSKYRGELSLKVMTLIFGGSLACALLGTVACTVGSYILIPILYPDQFADIKQYFIVTNLSQVLYFIANVVTIVLLRFAKSRYQIYVNVAYAVSFVAICIPSAIIWDFWGFCIGLLATCAIRFLVSIALGYFTVLNSKPKKKNA